MGKQHVLGNLGEEAACKYLIGKGYEILERNWRFSHAEIDIISRKDGILVFVEVKSRSYLYYGTPEEGITEHKENLIIDASGQYMYQNDYEGEIRYDIISIVFDNASHVASIQHYEDAFFPSI